MPFFSSKTKVVVSVRPKRIYSEREIEEKILSLPRGLQLRTLSVYQQIGKFEASQALSNLKLAREEIQDLDRELQRLRVVEQETKSNDGTSDPASFHTVIMIKRQLRKAEAATSAELRVEDETEFNN